MTLGDKIRKYRTLKGLTQKELGMKVGFSAATADSRIRKYEKDIMAPKEDIRLRLAQALDVDISALSNINIETYDDVMQVLFFFEETLGMDIERTEDKTYLSFDNKNPETLTLLSYLYTWYCQKKNLPEIADESSLATVEKYKKWKARFPQDINSYWDEQRNELNLFYEPIIADISNNREKITKSSEFIKQIRRMIQYKITLETGTKLYGIGDSALILTFLVSELLDTQNPDINKVFAEFLCDIKTLEEYGMPLTTDLYTNEKGTHISYYLRLLPLTGFQSIIQNIQNFELNIDENNDWKTEMFEMEYEDTLRMHELDLKEEINRFIQHHR